MESKPQVLADNKKGGPTPSDNINQHSFWATVYSFRYMADFDPVPWYVAKRNVCTTEIAELCMQLYPDWKWLSEATGDIQPASGTAQQLHPSPTANAQING